MTSASRADGTISLPCRPGAEVKKRPKVAHATGYMIATLDAVDAVDAGASVGLLQGPEPQAVQEVPLE
jgi:hypothetical protein